MDQNLAIPELRLQPFLQLVVYHCLLRYPLELSDEVGESVVAVEIVVVLEAAVAVQLLQNFLPVEHSDPYSRREDRPNSDNCHHRTNEVDHLEHLLHHMDLPFFFRFQQMFYSSFIDWFYRRSVDSNKTQK
ncbi:hypothetical protein GCK72_001152 [Caenorhabditis remanei]|uniref:Uncharacterized protein n=1 Tax=Caenorhabditis remanei TaxID=31234 RepID=A0A6A5HNZ2_CAERE|nr:hypothetical protein GCK72_001152 [Caenorhabditis remanei]KAF1769335.1 hypothetical protein GCK72_001152 [Caenorhabditis remanei]